MSMSDLPPFIELAPPRRVGKSWPMRYRSVFRAVETCQKQSRVGIFDQCSREFKKERPEVRKYRVYQCRVAAEPALNAIRDAVPDLLVSRDHIPVVTAPRDQVIKNRNQQLQRDRAVKEWFDDLNAVKVHAVQEGLNGCRIQFVAPRVERGQEMGRPLKGENRVAKCRAVVGQNTETMHACVYNRFRDLNVLPGR